MTSESQPLDTSVASVKAVRLTNAATSHSLTAMSSYDQPQEYISVEEFRESMRLVRLQIAIPISGGYRQWRLPVILC